MLWYWGFRVRNVSPTGVMISKELGSSLTTTKIAMPIAFLMWINGIALFFGLPEYFRQGPLQNPSFYRSIMRRKIILVSPQLIRIARGNCTNVLPQWFFVTAVIQSYFLALPYGRNWRYLWSSQHAPAWTIALLIIGFFMGVWATLLSLFGKVSTQHPWIIPIFAVGVGAPRWAQILWSTSSMGSWIPWAGTPLGGALVGRALWLWLGVLDAIQLVGFGMILLQTLPRLHIAFTVVCTQMVGTVAAMAARASAPPFYGAGDNPNKTNNNNHSNNAIFPNFALDGVQALRSPWFWAGLVLQIGICAGFFKFFRKEQMQKQTS